ncbi:MAG: 30S ribosomal protein S5, partial [Planctomycetota bacterium]
RINRTSTVVKGGRRFSFSAVVIIGDRRGVVGYGQGKAREVPTCIEKATRDARKNLVKVPLRGDTIPHLVVGRFRASKVVLRPAAPGTGIKAGAAVRAVLEELGLRNILTKVIGSRNPTNVVKAVFNGLEQLMSKEDAFTLRGLPVYKDSDRPKLEPIGHDDDSRGKRGKKKDTRRKGKGGQGKPAAKAEVKAEVKAETKPDAKAKPEVKADKPAAKAEAKPEAKADKPAEPKKPEGGEEKKDS